MIEGLKKVTAKKRAPGRIRGESWAWEIRNFNSDPPGDQVSNLMSGNGEGAGGADNICHEVELGGCSESGEHWDTVRDSEGSRRWRSSDPIVADPSIALFTSRSCKVKDRGIIFLIFHGHYSTQTRPLTLDQG